MCYPISWNLLFLIEWGSLGTTFRLGKEPCCIECTEGFFEAEVHSYEKTVLNAFKEAKNAIVDFNKIKEVYQLRAKLERSAKGYVDLTVAIHQRRHQLYGCARCPAWLFRCPNRGEQCHPRRTYCHGKCL